jgi:hypothetical protein
MAMNSEFPDLGLIKFLLLGRLFLNSGTHFQISFRLKRSAGLLQLHKSFNLYRIFRNRCHILVTGFRNNEVVLNADSTEIHQRLNFVDV